MRTFKKFGVLAVVFALSAIGAANASAAEFTASATGSLTGKATETIVFTTNAGQVRCSTAATSGSIVSTAATNKHVTINLSGCTAFGLGGVHVSPVTANLTANGTAHIVNTVTITVTLGGCDVTITPQSVDSLDFLTVTGRIRLLFQLIGILYHGSGGLCGSSTFSNGTLGGRIEMERVGGGSISHHP